MPNNTIPQEILDAVAFNPDLSKICQIHTCSHAADASGAITAGAVLLAVSPIHDDHEGDGFRCLIGLPEDVVITPHLSQFFPG